MSLSTTIVGVILVLIILIPIYIIGLSQKREKKKQLQSFIDQGKSEGLKITECDQWREYFIGIDRIAMKLMYVERNTKSAGKSMIVDLNDFRSAEKVVLSMTGRKKDGGGQSLQKVELRLKPVQKNLPECSLEFFNAEKNSVPDNEIVLSDKWKGIVEKAFAASIAN